MTYAIVLVMTLIGLLVLIGAIVWIIKQFIKKN